MRGAAGPAPPAAGEGGRPPAFGEAFRAELAQLMAWRRDVRRFRPDPLPREQVRELIGLAALSPSVGNSQPWRWVLVEDPARRRGVIAEFERANGEAARAYEGAQAAAYAALKLAGLREAPVHLAVFCDAATGAGHGLGRATMPETLRDSVVAAVHAFWLLARAQGIGVGWVSILRPDAVERLLDVPAAWRLVAYLCAGWPAEEHRDPELVRHGWQERLALDQVLLTR